MAFISYKNKFFISSANIRVFPCAYRGYYKVEGDDVTAQVFDPEARATTEANFADTFHKVGINKPSYVVSWTASTGDDGSTLKCVIDGYYFEIKNCNIDDFFNTDANDNKIPLALCIQTNTIDLSSSVLDNNRQTKILKALTEDTEYLDVQIQGGEYIFNGLCLVPHTEVGETYKSLVPFRYRDTGEKDGNDKSIYVQELDPAQLVITDLLDTGTGKYSIKVISNLEEGTNNSTVASGDYSVAFGKRTKASGNFSTVVGNKSEATGESSFAFGEETKAQGKGSIAGGIKAIASNQGSVAFGDNVTTNADNQVVIGKYNQTDNNKAFIIANGTESSKSNKFTVSYQGDVDTKGTLTVAADKATNLGGTLTVANNKKTTLGGELEVKQATNLQNTLTVASNTEVGGTLDVISNTEIGGTLDVDGATTINSTLNTKGCITADGDSDNSLILGSEAAKSYGAISIYGEGASKVFEVEKTGATKIENSLDVSGATTINSTLNTKGNITANGAAGNDLVLGSDTANSYGSISVYGEASSKVFEVEKTGNASIAGTIKVSGAATLENTLNVAANKTTTLGGALNVAGSTIISNSLTIADDKNTTLGGNLEVKKDTTLQGTLVVADSKKTTLGGELEVNGKTIIGGDTSITGTITSSGAGSFGNITASGTANVTGATTLSSSLDIGGNTTIKNGGILEIQDKINDPSAENIERTGGEIIFKSSGRNVSGDLVAIAESTASIKYDSVNINIDKNLNLVKDGTYKKLTASNIDLINGDKTANISIDTSGRINTTNGIINNLQVSTINDANYIKILDSSDNATNINISGQNSSNLYIGSDKFQIKTNNTNTGLIGDSSDLSWNGKKVVTRGELESKALYQYFVGIFSKNKKGVICEEIHFTILTNNDSLFEGAYGWESSDAESHHKNLKKLHTYLAETGATHQDHGIPVSGYFRDSDDYDIRIPTVIYLQDGRIKIETIDPEDDNNTGTNFKQFKNFGWVNDNGNYYTEDSKFNFLSWRKIKICDFSKLN